MVRNILRNTKGFSLVDVIVAGAILSILVVMTFPLVSEFLMSQRKKTEEERLQIMSRMVDAYIKEHRSFFEGSNITTFAEQIEDSGNLIQREIELDVWERPRYFRSIQEQENFRDASFNVHYGFVYSPGLDGCWGEMEECDPTAINTLLDELLDDGTTPVREKFNQIEVPNGDFLIKFSDFDEKIKHYNQTTQRIKALVDALSEYGQLMRYRGIANSEPSGRIYFPPSSGPGPATLYYGPVRAETADETQVSGIYGAAGSSVILNDDGTVAAKMQRRLGMIALTRLLGLPDEYCCNAMKTFTSGGVEYEEGLFYYSNPRARVAGCGPAATTVADYKLPPRITVDEDECGK